MGRATRAGATFTSRRPVPIPSERRLRRALVVEETRAGDRHVHLWVSDAKGDGESVFLDVEQVAFLAADLAERVELLLADEFPAAGP